MWLAEFLLGMFLAYLLLSPRLRAFLFHRNHTPNLQTRIEDEEKREQKIELPRVFIPRDTHGSVQVDEDEVARWLKANPELRHKNGIKG